MSSIKRVISYLYRCREVSGVLYFRLYGEDAL
jgi:hypothetical protein